jgi:aerobic-type carbon monoxide dehydrogenase small subunit (CoxS/CutS family)
MIDTDEPRGALSALVNGWRVRDQVAVRQSLVDWLRHGLGLTGSHVGCEHGVCGACNVELDGRIVRGCLLLAIQADGATIRTIDGPEPTPEIGALQAAFFERAALQCGFCTPGMIMQAAEVIRTNPAPSRAEIRRAMSGNYCRCTGYHAIVDAVEAAARALREQRHVSSPGDR